MDQEFPTKDELEEEGGAVADGDEADDDDTDDEDSFDDADSLSLDSSDSM